MFPMLCLLDATPERPPLPESLLTESATDVDATEAGETEYEANLATVGALRGGAHATLSSLEVEWRALREVGLRLEPSYARVRDAGTGAGHDQLGVAGTLALGLFHNFRRDMHLQVELSARTHEALDARVFEPGETELPYSADLVSAARFGPWTLRVTVGGEAGDHFLHAPVHTDGVLLTPFAGDGRFGFFGLEVRADWARDAPLVLAPDWILVTAPLGLPFALSIALPVNVGADPSQTSYGLFVRLMLLTSREAEFGRERDGTPPP